MAKFPGDFGLCANNKNNRINAETGTHKLLIELRVCLPSFRRHAIRLGFGHLDVNVHAETNRLNIIHFSPRLDPATVATCQLTHSLYVGYIAVPIYLINYNSLYESVGDIIRSIYYSIHIMDKRRKKIDPDGERALRDDFDKAIARNNLTIPDALKAMRRISRLTQAEFAKHRGVSLVTLKLLESGKGNPRVETINKVSEIFGLQLGFVKKPRPAEEKASNEARLATLLRIKEQAILVFGEESKALAWLATRNMVLGNTPFAVIESEGARGAALVSQILSAIAYGGVV